MELLTREFAASIKATPEAVLNWISSGAIPAKLVRRKGRRIFVTDPEAARAELEERGLVSAPKPRAPKGEDGDKEKSDNAWELRTLDEWMSKEKYWKAIEAEHKAKAAELETLRAKRLIVDLPTLKREVATIVSTARTNLLSIATKAKTRANLTDAQAQIIGELVREILADLDRELSGAGSEKEP